MFLFNHDVIVVVWFHGFVCLKLLFWKFATYVLGSSFVKDALRQISKSPYVLVLIWKQYPENLAFLILRIIEFFTREVRKFLKK